MMIFLNNPQTDFIFFDFPKQTVIVSRLTSDPLCLLKFDSKICVNHSKNKAFIMPLL